MTTFSMSASNSSHSVEVKSGKLCNDSWVKRYSSDNSLCTRMACRDLWAVTRAARSSSVNSWRAFSFDLPTTVQPASSSAAASWPAFLARRFADLDFCTGAATTAAAAFDQAAAVSAHMAAASSSSTSLVASVRRRDAETPGLTVTNSRLHLPACPLSHSTSPLRRSHSSTSSAFLCALARRFCSTTSPLRIQASIALTSRSFLVTRNNAFSVSVGGPSRSAVKGGISQTSRLPCAPSASPSSWASGGNSPS
mmetsp:Transcript_137377/g.242767  ORF Transcript_137377/g.242767 Transcript_137377/m.242767 type:complete len:252 (-) Transcript_137377:229-984(-)